MSGSFIQSHWPCRTLWPISMFSRILATERPAVPSDPGGLVARRRAARSAPSTASRRWSSIMLADVVGVAVAEVGVDLVVDARRTRGRSPRSARRVRRAQRVLDHRLHAVVLVLPFSRSTEFDLDGALGGVDAGADHLARRLPWTSPVRRSRTLPERSLPDAGVADAHRGSRTGSSSPASSPATRIGLLPSHSASQSRLEEARSCRPRPRSPSPADDRLEALHVQALAVAVRLPVLLERVEHARRARRGTSRARASRGTARRGRCGRHAAVLARCAARAGGSRRARSSSSRSSSPKITSSGVRAECRCTTSSSASRRSRSRSMLMIGVIPLPALMNSSLLGQRVGQHELALDAAEATRSRPAAPARTRYGETVALVDELERDRDAAVGAARGRRSASTRASGARRRRRRRCAGTGRARGPPTRSRADHDGRRVVGLAARSRSIRPRSSRVDHSGLISSR